MRVFRHLGPTAMRALFLVFAGSPVRMTDFLGLNAGYEAERLDRKEVEAQLKEQRQGWTQQYVGMLFNHQYVKGLKPLRKSGLTFIADKMQRKVVFNIILQRMLTQNPKVKAMKEAFILEGNVGEYKLVKVWLQRMEEREKRRRRWSVLFDQSLANALNVEWESSSGIATFGLNEYQIVIGKKQNKLGEYSLYTVGGVCGKALEQRPPLLFVVHFVAPESTDGFMDSRPEKVPDKD
ncbi:hypothetical protein ACQY0O_000080 [Thecaphora frezii]